MEIIQHSLKKGFIPINFDGTDNMLSLATKMSKADTDLYYNHILKNEALQKKGKPIISLNETKFRLVRPMMKKNIIQQLMKKRLKDHKRGNCDKLLTGIVDNLRKDTDADSNCNSDDSKSARSGRSNVYIDDGSNNSESGFIRISSSGNIINVEDQQDPAPEFPQVSSKKLPTALSQESRKSVEMVGGVGVTKGLVGKLRASIKCSSDKGALQRHDKGRMSQLITKNSDSSVSIRQLRVDVKSVSNRSILKQKISNGEIMNPHAYNNQSISIRASHLSKFFQKMNTLNDEEKSADDEKIISHDSEKSKSDIADENANFTDKKTSDLRSLHGSNLQSQVDFQIAKQKSFREGQQYHSSHNNVKKTSVNSNLNPKKIIMEEEYDCLSKETNYEGQNLSHIQKENTPNYTKPLTPFRSSNYSPQKNQDYYNKLYVNRNISSPSNAVDPNRLSNPGNGLVNKIKTKSPMINQSNSVKPSNNNNILPNMSYMSNITNGSVIQPKLNSDVKSGATTSLAELSEISHPAKENNNKLKSEKKAVKRIILEDSLQEENGTPEKSHNSSYIDNKKSHNINLSNISQNISEDSTEQQQLSKTSRKKVVIKNANSPKKLGNVDTELGKTIVQKDNINMNQLNQSQSSDNLVDTKFGIYFYTGKSIQLKNNYDSLILRKKLIKNDSYISYFDRSDKFAKLEHLTPKHANLPTSRERITKSVEPQRQDFRNPLIPKLKIPNFPEIKRRDPNLTTRSNRLWPVKINPILDSQKRTIYLGEKKVQLSKIEVVTFDNDRCYTDRPYMNIGKKGKEEFRKRMKELQNEKIIIASRKRHMIPQNQSTNSKSNLTLLKTKLAKMGENSTKNYSSLMNKLKGGGSTQYDVNFILNGTVKMCINKKV